MAATGQEVRRSSKRIGKKEKTVRKAIIIGAK
jgi:hypothetical protein